MRKMFPLLAVAVLFVTIFLGGFAGPILPPVVWLLLKCAIVFSLFMICILLMCGGRRIDACACVRNLLGTGVSHACGKRRAVAC